MSGGTRMNRKVGAALVALVVLGAACGTRVDDDEALRSQDGQLGGTSATTTGGGGAGNGGNGGTDTSTPAGAGFGDMASPCGPGEFSGATDVGVTDETIKVGVIADVGSVVPGLNQELHDGMIAFAGWCNDQGGIGGRQVELVLYDAKLSQYRERILEACDESFALVGGGGVFDELGAQDAVDCGLVEVPGFTVSFDKWEIGTESGLMFSPLPNPTDSYKVGAAEWIAREFPDVVAHGANIWGNAPVVDKQAANHREAYEQVGYEFVYEGVTPISGTVSDYSQFVVAMRDAGVRYFTFTHAPEELGNFQAAMRQQGWAPEVTDLEAQFYSDDYLATAGEAAEGGFVRIAIAPFEEADEYPAMAHYLDAMDTYNPDGKVAMLGVFSFSAGLLFATAAEEVGDDLTRDRVAEQLAGMHEWSAGGLHGTTDPGSHRASPCFIILEISDGAFVRRYPQPDDEAYRTDGPDRGFACPEDSIVELD